MRRTLTVLLAIPMLVAFSVAPAAAGEKLDVQISTVDSGESPSDSGTFTVAGEAARLLCASGTWQADAARFWNWRDEGFKIRVDRVFTCGDGSERGFVLELRGTIVLGEGCVGNCIWKLKESTGFDPAPFGNGAIVGGEAGEGYAGLLMSK